MVLTRSRAVGGGGSDGDVILLGLWLEDEEDGGARLFVDIDTADRWEGDAMVTDDERGLVVAVVRDGELEVEKWL